jgi:hypothetical protein
MGASLTHKMAALTKMNHFGLMPFKLKPLSSLQISDPYSHNPILKQYQFMFSLLAEDPSFIKDIPCLINN